LISSHVLSEAWMRSLDLARVVPLDPPSKK
jgi:hypothetical protein